MRCRLCSGVGLVLVADRGGYHVYRGCPACHGKGVITASKK